MSLFHNRRRFYKPAKMGLAPVDPAEISAGAEFIHVESGERVTVNFVEKNKVNYSAPTGDYSMLPSDFARLFARPPKTAGKTPEYDWTYETGEEIPEVLGSGSSRYSVVTTKSLDEAMRAFRTGCRNYLRRRRVENGRFITERYDVETGTFEPT